MQCKFCNTSFPKESRTKYHQNYCKLNPNRQKGSNQFSSGLFEPRSLEVRQKISASKKGQTPSQSTRSKTSRAILERVRNGTWHYSLANRYLYEYNGIKFQGSWEVKYAKWLDSNQIKWRRPKETFSYTLDGKEHRYTPDFYLIDEQTYVEIKGYKTRKDEAKWNQFPLKLKVLMKDDLKKLFDLQ